MYQDVSNLSKGALDKLITDLTELRRKMQNASDVDYKGLREVSTYIEKLKDARNAINPLGQLAGVMKEVNKLRKEGYTYDSVQQDLLNANDAINSYQAQIDDLETIIGLKEQQKDGEVDTSKLTANQQKLYKESVSNLREMLETNKENLSTAEDDAQTANDRLNAFKRLVAVQEASLTELQQIQGYLDSSFDSIYSIVELYGEVDEGVKAMAKGLMDGAFQAVQLTIQIQEYTAAAKIAGAATNAMLGVIGWIALAIQTIASVWSGLAGAHDNDLTNQIKKLKNNVDDLSRAYDKLKTAMEQALSFGDYQQDFASAKTNIERQISNYNSMIALEQQKKKSDSDAIREYRQAIEDLQDDLKELEETKITDLGGFGESNYRDIAEEFVSAWLDAYKETGDGLDALNDKWDEYVENLFLKQATINKAAKTYSKVMEVIDNAIESGKTGVELEDSIAYAKKLAEEGNEEMNNYLKMLAEVFNITADGSSELSDLQQGIQNITEEQAAAIEAYMNSIRFYVAMQYDVLCQIQQTLNAIRQQYSTSDNPTLNVLRDIRDSINSYASKLAGAFKSTASGYKLQVC
jgi:chromosome segregation ATPase